MQHVGASYSLIYGVHVIQGLRYSENLLVYLVKTEKVKETMKILAKAPE